MGSELQRYEPDFGEDYHGMEEDDEFIKGQLQAAKDIRDNNLIPGDKLDALKAQVKRGYDSVSQQADDKQRQVRRRQDKIYALWKERDALKAQVERLTELLEDHGRHTLQCPEDPCTCGWDAYLKAATKGGEDAAV